MEQQQRSTTVYIKGAEHGLTFGEAKMVLETIAGVEEVQGTSKNSKALVVFHHSHYSDDEVRTILQNRLDGADGYKRLFG